jgi:hypothetical protein
MPEPDTLAELLEARLAIAAAERRLGEIELDGPGRPESEGALEHARERYAQAVKAHEATVAARYGCRR